MPPIADLRERYRRGEADPSSVVDAALLRADINVGRNVYLARDEAWSQGEAATLRVEEFAAKLLWGVPVSLKDCFDLAGFRTSCGSKFYQEANGVAAEDSAVAARLKSVGAVITGKTHLHQLAYGITGENKDFGDCAQPADATRLTGGSSSGAAASVQEGSALAAIGTDTGGSIRVPAALCGLAGYRASIEIGAGLWRGGAHLAPSFDTIGWLYKDLRDGPALADALFGVGVAVAPSVRGMRVGVPGVAFLHDAESTVVATLHASRSKLEEAGAVVVEFDAAFWEEAMGIFAPIQACEAAATHRGNFAHFETAIAERLAWGASLAAEEVTLLRGRLAVFRARMLRLFERFDCLLLPCSPMAELRVGADHSQTRMKILRYTAPVSLVGLPAVTLPVGAGGLQLVGPPRSDAALLALSVAMGDQILR